MDEVDVALHLEPLAESVKELKEQLNIFSMSIHAKIDAIVEMHNRHSDVINKKIDHVLDRTKPKSSCLFCSIEDNRDNHPTGRCCRFPDAVSRAVQAANLRLCNRCLQPRHSEDCMVACAFCAGEHNVLLCPNKQSLSTSFKRRKN